MLFEQIFPVWNKLTAQEKETLRNTAFKRTAAKGRLMHNGASDCVGPVSYTHLAFLYACFYRRFPGSRAWFSLRASGFFRPGRPLRHFVRQSLCRCRTAVRIHPRGRVHVFVFSCRYCHGIRFRLNL